MGCQSNPIDPGTCFLTGGSPWSCLFCTGGEAMMHLAGVPEWKGPPPTPVSPQQLLEKIKRHHKLVPATWLWATIAIGVLIALFF